MTVNDLTEKLQLTPLAGEQGFERTVSCGYVGDLLSWVMGRAPEDSAWITVMGNVNAVAVASLADISCIILCEKSSLDEEAKAQADDKGIAILSSELPAWELVLKINSLLPAGEN